MASFYESLLLSGIVAAIGFALLPLLDAPSPATGAGALSLPSPTSRAISFATLVLACAAYCAGQWSGGRRTLAMKAWRLAIEARDGGEVGVRTALARYLACWIAPACAIGAYLALRPYGRARWALAALAINHAWALVDPGGHFLQDRIAGTRLVYEPREA